MGVVAAVFSVSFGAKLCCLLCICETELCITNHGLLSVGHILNCLMHACLMCLLY
jgi:hypothetical protein